MNHLDLIAVGLSGLVVGVTLGVLVMAGLVAAGRRTPR